METTTPTNDRAADRLALLDPKSCGEDLAYNAQRFSALAPRFCLGCADYHIRNALHRYTGSPKFFDRPELIRLIGQILAEKVTRSQDTIEIAIAGSADTAVLASAAHAAATLGPETLKRCRFTVLDRCRTPLLVCQEFAARHGLDYHSCLGDLMVAAPTCAADLIISHSVLRFIPHADQRDMLKRIGSWLAPKGRLILSNRILFDDDGTESRGEIRKRAAANKAAKEALEGGQLHLAESAEATLGRLDRSIKDGEGRPGEFQSLDEVRSLVQESGLAEISVESHLWEFAIGPDDLMQRRRVLAVLERAGERLG